MWTLVVLCSVIASLGVQGADQIQNSEEKNLATGSPDSCLNSCGNHVGNCSCSSSCETNGDCCPDYYDYCSSTAEPAARTARSSCRYNCGWNMGTCSCASSCQYYGNCCHDYNYYCPASSTPDPYVTPRPSCRYNCGGHMGSCSCSSSCQNYGNCCYDYYSTCRPTTVAPTQTPTARPSCRYNCGGHMGSCSCSSSCQYYGNCCYDYYSTCRPTTVAPTQTPTARPSCRYNCGGHMGSCSCSSSCQYYGNCCYDYYSTCRPTTVAPTQTPTARPSCRYNCGGHMGSCSCSSSCQYYGNCCYDYYSTCRQTTAAPTQTPTGRQSCRNYCGYYLTTCSCTTSCRGQGNCCYDYNSQCLAPGTTPSAQPSCRYNCGRHMGSCSCSSSCQYYGNCCNDYYSYCQVTTDMPTTASPCGGSLYGSGSFSSPNHPNSYHNNANCVWQLRAAHDQRIFLSFDYLQLENCCGCDYINVYDGPSVNSRFLGKVCYDSLQQSTFYSTSNYMTVLFQTDGSVVGRGFNADFISSLPASSGRVDCSSDNMNIVIERSYLNSLGYDVQSLYLNDQYCRPQVSSYQVVFNFPINTCGNVRKFENGSIVYTNSLRAYASTSGEITRQSHFKMNVGCRMEPDSVSQIMYVVRHNDNSSITGTGRFNTSMALYTSYNFYYQVTEVPYMVTLNQYMYVQVDLGRGDSSLVLYLDTCVTSPSPHDFQNRSHYLVRNGCPVDNTYYAYVSGTHPYARFRFQAFQFLRATESVYIQCKVLICLASDNNSRCRRGCYNRAARDVGSKHDSQTLVLGPIQLKEPEKQEEETPKQEKA
ncbi:deleted in malignant brain tumors 1 protein-like isoform X3 [Gymnodraco acuticeps]|uniref:Deleted in malignant brain tumors 1 protein-like isoform X3 n=1 Tax=Gymnodraco acuticeps TaxID=8218 RepID=A0A6P8VSG4_GYMAC|nr:deleted in malignant brain tumors 1 protein-like isoform X3 [Gymnodraco acuticeps]